MLSHDHSRTARAERRLARGRGWRQTGRMRTSVDHLPAGKRRELTFVVEVLVEEFKREVSTRASPHLKDGEILKIVLFGSYARGDWVENPVGRYFSDYDLLIVVEKDKFTDVLEFWEGAERRLSALSGGRELRTPVNFIVHTLEDVNAQLERGRYFFVDIVRDGITLLDAPEQPFVQPRELSPATALAEAERYLQEWLPGAERFLTNAQDNIARGWGNEAAFLLHQSSERLYNGLLLVLMLYTPKSHNLIRLRQLAEPLDPRLAEVWPTTTKFEKRCFELLRAAYVKARYSRHYQITREELDWISGRVKALRDLVQEICEGRLAELRAASAAASREAP